MDLFDHPGATDASPGIPKDLSGAPRNLMVAPNDLSGAQSDLPGTQSVPFLVPVPYGALQMTHWGPFSNLLGPLCDHWSGVENLKCLLRGLM